MKQSVVAGMMRDLFDSYVMSTRAEGQAEYAGEGNDAFANFIRLAEDLDMDRKKVLWVYAMKHKDGIATYLNGHTSQREDVTGRIKDLIVYLFLLWCMIEEEREVPGPDPTLPVSKSTFPDWKAEPYAECDAKAYDRAFIQCREDVSQKDYFFKHLEEVLNANL